MLICYNYQILKITCFNDYNRFMTNKTKHLGKKHFFDIAYKTFLTQKC